jgi:hypothetical protein
VESLFDTILVLKDCPLSQWHNDLMPFDTKGYPRGEIPEGLDLPSSLRRIRRSQVNVVHSISANRHD